jgi:hypothetical protein
VFQSAGVATGLHDRGRVSCRPACAATDIRFARERDIRRRRQRDRGRQILAEGEAKVVEQSAEALTGTTSLSSRQTTQAADSL